MKNSRDKSLFDDVWENTSNNDCELKKFKSSMCKRVQCVSADIREEFWDSGRHMAHEALLDILIKIHETWGFKISKKELL